MRTEDMVLVSVDDHLVEPPDLFTARMPASIAMLQLTPKRGGLSSYHEAS